MSNPFDQFTSDFHAALPPAPSFPAQQPQAYPGSTSIEQHSAFGGYEQQSYGPPDTIQNSYDGYSNFGSQPQPQQPVSPARFSDGSKVDVGNPFASMESQVPTPGMPPFDQQYYQPGMDVSQQGSNLPPAIPPGQSTFLDSSLTYPPPPAPDASAYADPWGGAFPRPQQDSAYGGTQPPTFSAQLPEQQSFQQTNPYSQQQQPQPDPNAGALVPAQQQSNPYAQPQIYGQPTNPYSQDSYVQMMQDPYYGQQQGYGQPYGQPQLHPQPQQYQPPPPPPPIDPFSVFESQSKGPETAPSSTALVPFSAGPDPTASDDDFWGSFGADTAQTQTQGSENPAQQVVEVPTSKPKVEEEKKGDEGLPPGGEFYDARIFTPTLGVMFFKPQELTDSLFLNTDRDIVDALGERPVVAFIVEGSSARAAGVELGHVLLKVNGVDVRSPKEASRLIKEGPRPLPLLFYVPNTDVVTAEGEHMVKYDTKETAAPNSAKDWKPKYVVIGGIIAQPWMMNMYRSKSEYDIAVIETQARRPVSVKVKQFSLQGARIQNDWQGPQMVKYKNKLHPWKYIVVLPIARNPIKISSPNLSQLKPVHEGIRRVLLAQQRDRGGPSRSGPGRSGENYGRAYNGVEDRGYTSQQTVSTHRY